MLNKIKANQVVMSGICSDINSSYMPGASLAPALIRKSLYSGSANLTAENGISIKDNSLFCDIGDLDLIASDFVGSIESNIEDILQQGGIPLTLGGDHAITYPIVKAMAKHYSSITILHFDAHPDLYDEMDGNPLSHACPFARIMENSFASRLIQVGIRTLNTAQRLQVERFSVECNEMKTFNVKSFEPMLSGPLYISFDMDALDPAFAPGVSHFEPGGLSVRDVLSIIQQIDVNIIGADIVEYNPNHDINGMTAMVAAKLVKEITAMILQNNKRSNE